jgi:hypothetical protein
LDLEAHCGVLLNIFEAADHGDLVSLPQLGVLGRVGHIRFCKEIELCLLRRRECIYNSISDVTVLAVDIGPFVVNVRLVELRLG